MVLALLSPILIFLYDDLQRFPIMRMSCTKLLVSYLLVVLRFTGKTVWYHCKEQKSKSEILTQNFAFLATFFIFLITEHLRKLTG